MPETSSPEPEAAPAPSTVGNTFMRQYYHFLAKEPQSLHRFYKAESRWCHGLGSHMEEPIAGQRAINDQILKRGYAGARVDLDAGSIDCQNSLGGGVLVLVTGVMTLRSSSTPKPFVQTFFLAVQPKGYFVLNDCLRFLELPGAAPVEVVLEDKKVQEKVLSPAKNGKKTETQAPTSPVKKVKEEPVPVSPKKVESPVKAVTKTTIKKVVKEAASPVKATATVASSPVKKTTTTTTTTTTKTKTKEETPAAEAVKTPSPVKSPAKSPVKSPKKQEKKEEKKKEEKEEKKEKAPAAAPVAAPADPVVPAPAEPEKPKTWAALFSGAKAVITSSAATPAPASTPAPVKPSTPKAAAAPTTSPPPTTAPAPAPIAATTGAAAPEKSPKNKSGNGNGKEKEHKRLYSLFIRDVPSQTRDNDLRELFKGYGSIAGVNVVAQRGFAFVDYYEEESMRAALAESKEFKVHDKVLQVDERTERKEGQRGGFRGNDSRGRGRGHGPKGGRGERKERNGDDAPSSNKGERRDGARREKTGNRRGGKVDATSQNRSE